MNLFKAQSETRDTVQFKAKNNRSLIIILNFYILLGFFLNTSTILANPLIGPFMPSSGSWATVTDGGFEAESMSVWGARSGFVNDYSGTFAVSSQQSLIGQFSAESNPRFAFDGSGFSLANAIGIPLEAGVAYVLSGFIQAPTASLDAFGPHFYLDLCDLFNLPEGILPMDVQVPAQPGITGWQFVYSSPFTPTANAEVFVRMAVDGRVTPSDIGYFDEIAITRADQFSLPRAVTETASTAGLTTLGLAGLLFIRFVWNRLMNP